MEAVQKNHLESVLNLVADSHAGTANQSLLMKRNIFLILTSYLVAKVVREPLILRGGGVEIKSYDSVLQLFVLLVIQLGKSAENTTDYSLNNAVRQILFLPTTTEEKYNAKVATDSFFVRGGHVLSAGLVFVGVTWLSFIVTHFALVCLSLVSIWLFLAINIGFESKRLVLFRELDNHCTKRPRGNLKPAFIHRVRRRWLCT